MKNQFLLLLLLSQVTLITKTFSQNIAINGTGSLPDTSAMLDVSSTVKGFLAPRMTTTQQNAIPLPAKGLMIFNTTDNAYKVNTGTTVSPVWATITTGSAGIALTALSATAPLSYNNTTGIFSITQAATAANGYLSSTDWNTFNSKQTALSGTGYSKFAGSSVSYVTAIPNADLANSAITIQGTSTALGGSINVINGTGFVKATGTTISYDNNTYLTTASAASTYEPKITAPNSIKKYLNGYKQFVSLNTDSITEGSTNLYFTNARARTAISLTTTGTSGAATYNNTTGVLNIPAYATSSGTVTSVGLTSSDITVGGSSPITTTGTYTLTLPTINSNVGTFNNVTVNGKGQVTAASNVSYLTANQAITVTATGDATGTSSSSATAPSLPLTLATVNSNVGSFTNANVTVNAKGLVTAVSNGTATTVGLLVDADRTSAYTPGSSYSTLIYNVAPTNVGTAYSTSTGIFTAPATGLYQIMISNLYSVANSVNNTISAKIIVNGSTETQVWTSLTPYSGSTIYGTLYGATVVSMSSGQTAYIQIGGLNNTMTPNVGTGQHTLKIIRLN